MLVAASDDPVYLIDEAMLPTIPGPIEVGAQVDQQGDAQEDRGSNRQGQRCRRIIFPFWPRSQRHELPLIPGLKSWPRAICSARAVVVPFHKHGKVLKSLPISANEPKAVVVLRGTLAIGLAMGV